MENVLNPLSPDEIKILSKSQLVTLAEGEQSLRLQLENENAKLREQCGLLEEQKLEIAGKFIKLKHRLFGKSSEIQEKPKPRSGKSRSPRKRKASHSKKPSERYPHLPIHEKTIELEKLPACSCCKHEMEATQIHETSEELTVTPRKYHITRYHRRKYRCGHCYGSIVTSPALPRIIPGSSYSDEMIMDVALSKFCDLIPMERYSAMAMRQGVDGLPPNSLITLTHKFADFLRKIYEVGLKQEVIQDPVIRCDESPHRMLEGDDKTNWYLWQFAANGVVYFEYHNTRSGDIAIEVLKESSAIALLTDDFAGYHRAVRIVNDDRKEKSIPLLQHGLCNAHSRRKFVEAELISDDAKFYIEKYGKIYEIEAEVAKVPLFKKCEMRAKAIPEFEAMLSKAKNHLENYPSKSLIATAINYFISNYQQLTLYLQIAEMSIDNNATERPMRSPAIGRKTWYGTHSRRGAETAAIIFSIVESCKVNSVNPRQYIREMVNRIHYHNTWVTPLQYRKELDSS